MILHLFNPLKWPRHELISLAISAVLSGSLGILIGYVIYALAQGAGGGSSFHYWFWDCRWFWWAFFGIIYAYLNFLSKKLVKDNHNDI